MKSLKVDWWINQLKEIESQLSEINERRNILLKARTNAKRKIRLYRDYTTGKGNSTRDTEYVEASILKEPILLYLKTNQLKTLAQRTKVDSRVLARIRDGKKKFLTLTVADRIATELGRTDLLNYDTILTVDDFAHMGNLQLKDKSPNTDLGA